jgi:actin-related protein
MFFHSLNFGGREVTVRLQNLLNEGEKVFTTFAKRKIFREIKEKVGYVAVDFEEELRKAKTTAVK